MAVPSIALSNGHSIDYLIASGGLAYDGRGYWWEKFPLWLEAIDPNLFTAVSKTVTRYRREGNYRWWKPWDVVRFIPDGTVNAFELTNPGFDWWHENIGMKVSAEDRLIASILGEPEEISYMAERLDDCEIIAVENNVSCPNTGDDILRNSEKAVRSLETAGSKSHHPLIAKLSVAHDLAWILPRIQTLVEAISINSVPWWMFSDQPSPLAHYGGGGVSGKAAQPHTWGMVREIAEMEGNTIPVIGPSIWQPGDIQKVRAMGAQAVSAGSVLIGHLHRAIRMFEEDWRANQ